MKLEQLLNMNNVMKNIIDGDNSIDSAFKFRLLGIMKKLEPSVQNYGIVQNDLMNKYGTQDDEGRVIIRKDDTENFSNFEKELKTVLDQDVEIDLPKIKQSDVINKGIPANQLIQIYDLLEA